MADPHVSDRLAAERAELEAGYRQIAHWNHIARLWADADPTRRGNPGKPLTVRQLLALEHHTETRSC
jgi:hypothetical protein